MLSQDKIVEIYMFCTLPHLGMIKIQGKDAKKFLQGQLTCDVENLVPTQSCMGAHCTPQGRVISLFYLFLLDEAYYLLMHKEMVPIAMNALKKYAVFFKTELSDASTSLFILGSQQSPALLPQSILSIPLSPTSTRHFIICKTREELSKLDISTDIQEWHYQNIEEKIPTIYPQTSGKFLAHELNLDKLNAIHFDKGCYTGQEIIARMHYRSKLKTRLRKAIINSNNLTFSVGLDIYTKQNNITTSCGMLVDFCQKKDTHRYYLLIALNELNNNTAFFIHDDFNLLTLSE
jgi:folate-binding protein YgfZ